MLWKPITVNDLDRKQVPPNVAWEDAPILLINGTAGSGKTTFAKTWCMLSGAFYCSSLEFIEHLKNNCPDMQSAGKHINRLNDAPRLVIDDLVNEPKLRINIKGTQISPVETFRTGLFARCQPNKRTMIITNAPLKELYKRYDETEEEEMEDGRLYSRMQEFATHYKFLGDRRQGKEFRLEKHQVATAVCTIEMIPTLEKKDLPDTKEAEIKATLKFLADKDIILDPYCEWLKTTEFKNLIPKEYYDRAKMRAKAEQAAAKEKKRVARAVAGRGVGGDSISGGVPRGDEGGKSAGERGADGTIAVDENAVPNW